MKRLHNIMKSMDERTSTYTEMYNGRMRVYDPGCPGMPSYMDENPVYYQGSIGYEIRSTHKLAQDKPTINIFIPAEMILEQPVPEVPVPEDPAAEKSMPEGTLSQKSLPEKRIEENPMWKKPITEASAQKETMQEIIKEHKEQKRQEEQEEQGEQEEQEEQEKQKGQENQEKQEIQEEQENKKEQEKQKEQENQKREEKRQKGEGQLKRLKYFLQHMEESTSTYKEMYKGEMVMHFPPSPEGKCMEPEKQYDSTYWYKDMAVEIESDHKLAQDRPVVTWNIPTEYLGIPEEACIEAAADFCLREFQHYIDELNKELYNRSRPDEENGKYYISRPGGEILTGNGSCFALHSQKDYKNGSGISVYLLNDDVSRPMQMCLCLKVQVQLPRKKLSKATRMLCKDLPDAVDRFVEELDREGLKQVLELAEKQAFIRSWLKHSEYCAFLANGSILPRAKGTDLPMEGAVPFQSVPQEEIEICGIRGMGIRKGVTVITGGGYSGKSTLLDAVSAGIYNHVLGDGRELCITDETAFTISAEDGRSVKCVNISPFIKWLPGGDTKAFSTERASGSTSQAANIMEAVDGGAGLLLIDEDRSATNFMIRDRMMKELIAREPITPFTDRVGELSRELGISTILVIGGSGEYLSVADKVYKMEDYYITDVTERAKGICSKWNDINHRGGSEVQESIGEKRSGENGPECIEKDGEAAEAVKADWKQRRILYAEGFTSYPQGSGSERLQISDMGFVLIGDEKIDVRGLHNIVSSRQLDALGFMLRYLEIKNLDREVDLRKKVDELYERIRQEGLDFLYSSYFTTCRRFLDLPRKQELFALINRMRKVHFSIG